MTVLGFCSLKISFVLDNTVETIAFMRVNFNTDTVPTTTRLPCKLQKMRTVSVIKHAHRAGTCSFTVLCKSIESEFRRNCAIFQRKRIFIDFSMHLLFPYH